METDAGLVCQARRGLRPGRASAACSTNAGQARPAYTVWRESYASLELGAMYARLNNISKWDRGAALP